MKVLKLTLIVVTLMLIGVLSGCNGGYVGTNGREPTRISVQRADGLRIPTYAYTP